MADPRMQVIEGDITTLEVDAIVNAANQSLAPGGGVCGAIHRAAGPELAKECARLGGCEAGDAKLSGGYGLPAKHVIHAVGPVWQGGEAGEAALLSSCYHRALELAEEIGCTSIAFPAISTGIFGYPRQAAAEVAVRAVSDWLDGNQNFETVIFCCFDGATAAIYDKILDMRGDDR